MVGRSGLFRRPIGSDSGCAGADQSQLVLFAGGRGTNAEGVASEVAAFDVRPTGQPSADGGLSAQASSQLKRIIDVVGSMLLLVLLALPMLLIAAAVVLTSRGPALFRQERVGLEDETFICLKFRTMREERRSALLAASHRSLGEKDPADPRVTTLGRVLRRSSLDELPQLLNVLRGDMSLVGPRPHHLADAAQYSASDRARLRAKPGMTGLWQVSGRSDNSWPRSIELDLEYIETWNLGVDLRILLQTPGAVVSRRGAY